MADEIKVKMSEFSNATSVNDSDEIIILQNGDNKKVKSPILEQKIINKITPKVVNEVKEIYTAPTPLYLADETPTNDGLFVPMEYGTYTNGLDYNDGDGDVEFILKSEVWTKRIIPFPANGEVKEGDLRAVSGGEVANKTLLVKDYYTIGGNQFKKENIAGGYINGTTGLISSPTADVNTHCVSEIIAIVSGTEFIKITNQNNYGFRFLDSTNNPLEALDAQGNPVATYTTITNGIYYPPTNAVAYQFTVRVSGVGNPDIMKALINGIETNELKSGDIDNPINIWVTDTEVAEKTVLKSELLETKATTNLVDKSLIQKGFYLVTSNGNKDSRINCAISPKITVKPNTIYTFGGVGSLHNVVCYASNGTTKLKPLNQDGVEYSNYSIGSGNNIFKTPSNCAFLEFNISFDQGESTYDDTVQLNEGPFLLPYEPYGSREIIKPEFIDLVLSESSNIKKININNIDTLLFSGASHVEVNGTIRDKGFVSTVGALTDWNVDNYSRSGRSFLTTFNSVINDEERYGVKISELPGGYVVLVLGQNESTYFTTVDGKYLKDNAKACISAFQSRGFKPIISTYFGDNRHPYTFIIREIAEEMQVPYIDMEGSLNGYWNPLFRPYWYNGHTGTRVESMKPNMFLELMKENLPIPKRGMKIFRPKNTDETIENLLPYDNYDRLKKYTELSVGHRALKLDYEKYVDRLDKCSYTDLNGQSVSLPIHDSISSEYNQLRRGNALNFSKKAYIQFLTEDILASVDKVDFTFESNNNVDVYVRNYIDTSLAINTTGQTAVYRLVNQNVYPSVGQVLTDSNNVNTTFTVISIENGTVITNPSNSNWNTEGHMTGAISAGDVFYEYDNLSFGISPNYYNTALKPKGRWVKLTKIDDKYTVQDLALNAQYDKIEFLLVHTSDFTLKNIELSYESKGELKNLETKYSYNSANTVVGSTSLFSNNGFLDTFTTDWVTSITNGSDLYNGNYTYINPNGGTTTATQVPALYSGKQILKLKNTDSISKVFSSPTNLYGITKQIKVTICGRYNPYFNKDINNLVNPITKDTFDYKKLIVEFKRGAFRFQKEINLPLHWIEKEILLDVNKSNTDCEIKIISTDDDIELIKCDIQV